MRSSTRNIVSAAAILLLISPALSALAQSERTGKGGGVSDLASVGPNGQNLNAFLGADRFYDAGYTGTRAVVANIEAGHIWNGHEALQNVTTFLDARDLYARFGFDKGQLGQFDLHATWVGHAIAGRPTRPGTDNFARGVAYGATLWSGAFADEWTPNPNDPTTPRFSFGYRYIGLIDPYVKAMEGVGGRRADVINSSYSDLRDTAGTSVETQILDGLVRKNRTTVIVSAGNAGAGAGGQGNTVGGPGSGYNVLTVGSTGDASDPNFTRISSYSSRGPNDYAQPHGDGTYTTTPRVRAAVDIVAPGYNLYLAHYTGVSGGNIGGTDTNPGSIQEYNGVAGTSFSSPLVAGGATLLADVAHDRFASDIDNATDGEVVKAVLLNSADKLAGWDNGQTFEGGVLRTRQALDYAQGAGQLNLNRAFDQYTAGVTDLPGEVGGAELSALGWDYGVLTDTRLTNDYYFARPLLAGTTFTATLNWFVDRTLTLDGTGGFDTADNSFLNLSLQLWSVRNNAPFQLVMESDAAYINTEHFSSAIPDTDRYLLRVALNGSQYNFTNDAAQTYGLAWSGTSFIAAAAPEPATFWYGAIGVLCFVVCVSRKRQNFKFATSRPL